MKRVIALLCLITAVQFITHTAVARGADRNIYLAAAGILTFENLDEQQTLDKFSGNPGIAFDNSWGLQARLGHRYNDRVSAEAIVEYVLPFEAEDFGADEIELDVINLTVNAKLTCPQYKRYTPYAILGIGALNAYEDITYNGVNSTTSDWGLSFRAGLGIDYRVNEEFTIALEGTYAGGLGDVDHVRYTQISLGAAYHF